MSVYGGETERRQSGRWRRVVFVFFGVRVVCCCLTPPPSHEEGCTKDRRVSLLTTYPCQHLWARIVAPSGPPLKLLCASKRKRERTFGSCACRTLRGNKATRPRGHPPQSRDITGDTRDRARNFVKGGSGVCRRHLGGLQGHGSRALEETVKTTLATLDVRTSPCATEKKEDGFIRTFTASVVVSRPLHCLCGR